MYFIYSAVLALGLLLSFPYWLLHMVRHGKYRVGLSERLGRAPERLSPSEGPVIWIHAVSVGEVLAVSGLVTDLKKKLPGHRIVVSTTTDTGQMLARSRFGAQNVFYFPLDFAFAILPYLRVLRPELVVLAETEFWPNFLRLSHESGAQVAVVNARISDRSWPGYRRWRLLLGRVLANIDLFLAQTEEDQNRLAQIGALSERTSVSGNLKFDVPAPAPPPIVASLRTEFQKENTGPVLICGSTVDGEELLLFNAWRNIIASHPQTVMVVAPRHPERFLEVAQVLEQLGMRFYRRSLWGGEALAGTVVLLDSIGELASVYSLADIAFVGGSLVPRGGHNIIEPAQYGVPIVVGNYTENFRDIVALFRHRNAVRIVGPGELPLVLMKLIAGPAERKALGQRAMETWRSQTGATHRTVEALMKLLDRDRVPAFPERPAVPGAPQ